MCIRDRDDPTVLNLPTVIPELTLVKSIGDILDTSGDGLFGGLDDTIVYEFEVTNTGNLPLADITITDDLISFVNVPVTPSALLPGETAVLTGNYVIEQPDVDIGFVENTATANSTPVAIDPGTGLPDPGTPLIDPATGVPYVAGSVDDISDTGSEQDPDPNGDVPDVPDPDGTDSNGVPGDDGDEPTILNIPNLNANVPGLVVTKEIANGDASVVVGDVVPYTITVENPSATTAGLLDLVDELPDGMTFVPGSATFDGAAVTPVVQGQRVTLEGLTLQPGSLSTFALMARVDGDAAVGDLTNSAFLIDPITGEVVSNVASATVSRPPEAVFDCTDVVGKVFDDRNFDGYQNPVDEIAAISDDSFVGGKGVVRSVPLVGEPGLPRVRLVTPTGTIITTDEHGRYSVPCAEIPRDMGSNFTLKLDPRSLPTGYRVTTENPRTMRLTSGIMTEMNFGAALGRVLDIDLTAASFTADHQMQARLIEGIDRVLPTIADEPTVIRVTYFSDDDDRRVQRARLDSFEDYVTERWDEIGQYRLIIERDVRFLQ